MSAATVGPIDVSVAGGIGWVRLNVPERRNAISIAMRRALDETMGSLDDDPAVRVAVLTGNGSAFCAGVDLKEPAEPTDAANGRPEPVAAPLERFRKPLLAAVNGPAFGGGFELALAADLRIASTEARFALPEVKLGSLPGSGGTQRLSRAVSPAIANKLVFTGGELDAEAALACGLISDLVAPADLLPLAESIATAIADNAPLSLQAAKLALRAAQEDGLRAGLELERSLWQMLATSRDREEGRAAFREQRPPRFTGE